MKEYRKRQPSEKSVDKMFIELRCIDKQLSAYHDSDEGSLNKSELNDRINTISKLLCKVVEQFEIEHALSLTSK